MYRIDDYDDPGWYLGYDDQEWYLGDDNEYEWWDVFGEYDCE